MQKAKQWRTTYMRLEEELHQAIDEQALKEKRSKVNMIEVLLKRGMAASKGLDWEGRGV